MTSSTRRTFLQTITGFLTGTLAGSYADDERHISATHYIDRTSLRLFTNPQKYIDTSAVDHISTRAEMNITLNKIDYRADPLHGLYDVSHEPQTVLARMAGDCVDQGLLAASFIVGTLNRAATLYLFSPNVTTGNLNGHLVVSDGTFLYDTDGVHTSDTTLDDLNDGEYILTKTVTISPENPINTPPTDVPSIDTELTPGTPNKDSYNVCEGREHRAARFGYNTCNLPE